MKSALKRIFSRSVDQAEHQRLKLRKRHSLLKEETTLVDSIIKGVLCQGHNRKEMNPLDRNGQISRCVVCDSKMHWAKDCLMVKLERYNLQMSLRVIVNKL